MLKIHKLIIFFLFFFCLDLFAENLVISASGKVYTLKLPENIVTSTTSENVSEENSYFISYEIFPISDFIKNGLGKKFYTAKYYYKNFKTVTYENLENGLEKGNPLINDPGVYECWTNQSFDDFLIFDIYQNKILGSVMDSIGWYQTLVCKDDNVFLFCFYSRRPIDDFISSLSKYLKPNRKTLGKAVASDAEIFPGFPYAVYNAPKIFYEDMKNQNSDLPEYIRNFHTLHEEFLSNLVESFYLSE